MKISKVKKSLTQSINELVDNKRLFLKNPEKDFTRTRKISFKDVVSAILSFNDGTLNQELIDFFDVDPNIPTSSAFIQQRSKIKPEAFEFLFNNFTTKFKNGLVIADRNYEAYNNMAHIQEKGWKFLFRVKDSEYGIKNNFILPENDEFDFPIHLNLTRKQNKETMQLCNDPNRYRCIYLSTRLDYLPSHAKENGFLSSHSGSFAFVCLMDHRNCIYKLGSRVISCRRSQGALCLALGN